MPYLLFLKKRQNFKLSSAANYRWRFRVNPLYSGGFSHTDKYNKDEMVCFVALRPKSTAMVMAGWSVHLTIRFLGKLNQ